MEECIFCKIVNRKAQTEIVYEDQKMMAFKDINPRAPIHVLIIPKKHIILVNHLEKKDRELIGDLFLVAQRVAKEKELEGYKLVVNVGRAGGQLVDHLHLHLVSGQLTELP